MSGAGSVKQAANGSWGFVVDVRGSNGDRKQVRRRGFRLKHEATAAMAIVVADNSRGEFVRPIKGLTVRKFLLEEWLPTKSRAVKQGTAEDYRKCLVHYVVPHIGDLKMADVDVTTINHLFSLLLVEGRTGGSWRSGGLSAKTVRNVAGVLNAAFKDAVIWKRVRYNPCSGAQLPRKSSPEMKVWSPAQIQRFMSGVGDDRHSAIWHLYFTTGLRRGEGLGLEWADIDLTGGTVFIRRTVGDVAGVRVTDTPKTVGSKRRMALDAGTVSALRNWKRTQAAERLLMGSGWRDTVGAVITEPDGSRTSPQSLSRRFKELAASAGLPAIRLHDTRHSYATAALLAGVPVKVVSQRLGHSDVRITLMTYAHVLPGDDEDAADIAAAAIMGTSGSGRQLIGCEAAPQAFVTKS